MSRSFRPLLAASALMLLSALGGCSQNGRLSPVFGAVFGLEGADVAPYRVRRIPDPTVRPGDRVIGQAANEPDQCIYLRDGRTRFRAACPEGFST